MAYWTPKDYTPFFLWDEPAHTEKEIRKEYSRMRDIIVKRAKRLQGIGSPEFDALAEYMLKNTPKLKEIKDSFQVSMYTAKAWRLINDPVYSISGIKKIQDQLEEEAGMEIPFADVLDFHEYMKSWRTGAYRWIVDTNTASHLYYSDYPEYGGTFDNFYTLYMMDRRKSRD